MSGESLANQSNNSIEEKLYHLLAYSKAEGRICPTPSKWHELWEMLPERRRQGSGWEPAAPLILAAWWDTTEKEKQDRLEIHLQYAALKGALDRVEHFLFNLQPDEWVYGAGT